MLKYRFHRKPQERCLEDVFDGTAYVASSDFFSCKYNVSFALNYDGAPKFKSSKVQLWPVQLYLNELPPCIRYTVDVYTLHCHHYSLFVHAWVQIHVYIYIY